ncbi:MAG: nuclear transport factor 2 family protein [Acidimicrobiia bacterium]
MNATEFANFAEGWIAAWNSRDLDRILEHYATDVVIRTPRAADWDPLTGGVVEGLVAVRRYWCAALRASPHLRFELDSTLTSAGGGTILYRNHRGELVAETVVFDVARLVNVSVVSYKQI